MRKASLLLFALFGLLVPQGYSISKPPTCNDTIRLFNGYDLENWYTFIKDRGVNNDPKAVFSVTDNGLLRITGEEWGCITTEKEFKNYIITAEYKWGEATYPPRKEKARDSGLLFHSTGNNGAYSGSWMYSIECNIIEGGTGDFIVVGNGTEDFSLTSPVAPWKQNNSYIHHPYGIPATINKGRINWAFRDPNWTDVINFRGEHDVENPPGEWNTLKCLINKGEITIYLNGVKVNHAVQVSPSEGRIQIQSEGAEIFFRKIDLVSFPYQ